MKIKYLICLLLVIALAFCISCGGNTDTDTSKDTSSNTIADNDTSTDTSTDTNTDTSTDTNTDTDTDTDTDTNTDTSTDTNGSADVDTDTSTDTDTSKPDSEPEPEPEIPDEEITLFSNGSSEYTIVYPKNNDVIEALVKDFVSTLSTKYGVTIPYKAVDKDKDVGDKEIIVGFTRQSVFQSAAQMNSVNDFVFDVNVNDFVIYASYDAMYPYAFRILKDEILTKAVDGTLTIKPEDTYYFRKSANKDITFLNYIKSNDGSFNKDVLCNLFTGLSFTSTDGTTLPYRLYMPSNYDGSKDYPVIVFLHGAGERGNDNKAQMGNMLPAMFNQQNTKIENAIVVVPQCPGWPNQWVDWNWENGNYSIDEVPESNELKAVVELLNTIKKKYSTDENKYYAMGISMGGFGTWDLIMRHTEMFAAAVPVCGGADVSQAENLKYMPIFTAHAANDWSVPYTGTEAMVNALRGVGNTSVIFKCHKDGTLSSGGHLIWDEIGKDTQMLEWLFNQSKPSDSNELPPRPVLGPNETPFIPVG